MLSKTTRRVVVLNKKGDNFNVELVERNSEFPESLVSRKLYLSLTYPEVIFETVEVPPVEDEDTLTVLIKRQLAERANVTEDVLLVYSELETEGTSQKKSLRVFALPKSVCSEGGLLDEFLLSESEFFTLSQLSIAGVSGEVEPEGTVFHAFADEDTLVVTVSSGKEVIYTRSVAIPTYAREDGYEDFVHENINMTYLFVAQRSNIPVDLVLFSGNLIGLEDTAGSLSELMGVGIAVSIPGGRFKGIDGKTFNEFLPCFGALLLPGKYDFSPYEVKDRRLFRRILHRATVVLSLIVAVLFILLGFRLYEVSSRAESVRQLQRIVETQGQRILKDPFLEEDTFKYYLNYINALDRSRVNNPLMLLEDLAPFLKTAQAKAYVFARKNNKLTFYMDIDRRFPRLIDMTLYREKLVDSLERLRSKGYTYRIESEIRDVEENRLSMRLLVERSL
ncbi:hypothetical protein [Hydrogenivirga sp.]